MALPATIDNDNDTDEQAPAQFDFSSVMQRKIATTFMTDTQFAMKVKDMLKPEFFEDAAVGKAIEMVQRHVDTYKSAPDKSLYFSILKDEITANRLRPDLKEDVKKLFIEATRISAGNHNFEFEKVRDFARHQAMSNAIMSSVTLLQNPNKPDKFAEISKLMKQALAVGAETGSSKYDYFAEIANRTQEREDLKNGKVVKRGITTGYSDLDVHLYHMGWGRKELSVIMGAAKAGKSMAMGDFTKNAALVGYKAFYASCEVSAKIIAARTDAAVADTAVRDLHHDPKLIMQRIQAAQAKNGGVLMMEDFPSGTLKVSQLARIIERYRNDEGIAFDLVTVDYADIMAAEYRNDQLRDNLREIYIDLRALAHEFDCALLTATQTNREGAKAAIAKATDVGDDFNKIRTADVVIGINATDSEKLAGEARLYWAASRNTEDGFSLKIRQDRQKMQFLTKVIGKV